MPLARLEQRTTATAARPRTSGGSDQPDPPVHDPREPPRANSRRSRSSHRQRRWIGAVVAGFSNPSHGGAQRHHDSDGAFAWSGSRRSTRATLRARNFASYARYWAEGATLPRIDRHELLSQISIIEGEPALRAAMAAGNGVILALPHIGSWEWGGAYLAALGLPMTAVAERLEPEELFQFFVTKRNAMGLGVVPLDEGATGELSRILRSGGLVGLLCDRDLMGGGQPAQLFGEPVTIPKGPATLALRSGAALFVGVVYSGPGSAHYAIIEGPLNTHRADGLRKDVERVTSDIVAHLDGLIGRAPEQWHVFQPIFTSEGDAR